MARLDDLDHDKRQGKRAKGDEEEAVIARHVIKKEQAQQNAPAGAMQSSQESSI